MYKLAVGLCMPGCAFRSCPCPQRHARDAGLHGQAAAEADSAVPRMSAAVWGASQSHPTQSVSNFSPPRDTRPTKPTSSLPNPQRPHTSTHSLTHPPKRGTHRLDSVPDQGPHGDALLRQPSHHGLPHAASGACNQHLEALHHTAGSATRTCVCAPAIELTRATSAGDVRLLLPAPSLMSPPRLPLPHTAGCARKGKAWSNGAQWPSAASSAPDLVALICCWQAALYGHHLAIRGGGVFNSCCTAPSVNNSIQLTAKRLCACLLPIAVCDQAGPLGC